MQTYFIDNLGFWDAIELFVNFHSYGQNYASNTILYWNGGKVLVKCNNWAKITNIYRYIWPILFDKTLVRNEEWKWGFEKENGKKS